MKIMDFLVEKAISVNLKATDKKTAIKELVGYLAKAGKIKDERKLVKVLLERESLGSTGIGQGIAIPHGKSDSVKKLIAAVAISPKGVEFDSLDGEAVYIFFLLVAPHDSAGPHLKALARISRLLKDKFFRDSIRGAKSEADLIRIIRQEDERKY